MIKFLLDANLSPITAQFLRSLDFDIKSITEGKLGSLKDVEVVELAKKEKRIIITFDLDFGEIYHTKEGGTVGIMVLRIKNQTPEDVNRILKNFISIYRRRVQENPTSLMIIKEKRVRFVKSLE